MNNLPEKARQYGSTIFNFVKAVGPFLISQSGRLSEEFTKHKARLALVDVMKEALITEVKVLQSVKEKLLTRYIDSEDIERVRIKRDLKEIDESLKVININQKALLYLSKSKEEQTEPENQKTTLEISNFWLDRFNELAKLSNEPWREELLARALAKESVSPGSVSPRALWLIGTLEEKLFRAFSALLDISISVSGSVFIPKSKLDLGNLIISDSESGQTSIGKLVFLLLDVGLLADPLNTSTEMSKGGAFVASYGPEKFLVTCKSNLLVKGIICTNLGSSIASFYDVKPNELGTQIFLDWIDSLKGKGFEIINLHNPNANPDRN